MPCPDRGNRVRISCFAGSGRRSGRSALEGRQLLSIWSGSALLLGCVGALAALRFIGKKKNTGCGGDCASCACACNRREKAR